MIFVGVWSLLPPPIWNSENEHGWQVFHCASAAAIFIGWYSVSMTPELAADDQRTSSEPGSARRAASFADRRNTSGLVPRRRCQADTAEHDARRR